MPENDLQRLATTTPFLNHKVIFRNPPIAAYSSSIWMAPYMKRQVTWLSTVKRRLRFEEPSRGLRSCLHGYELDSA